LVIRIARKLFRNPRRRQGWAIGFFAQRAAARHQVVGYVRKTCLTEPVEALRRTRRTLTKLSKLDLATGPSFSFVEQVEEVNLEPTGEYSSFRIELREKSKQ